MTTARRVQLVVGWIVVAISLIHLAVTFLEYDQLSLQALWFVGSGFALLLIGGLNVIAAGLELHVLAPSRALLRLTLLANACGMVLGGLFIVLTGGSQPQGPVLVGLFLAGSAGQLWRLRAER